MRRVRVWEVPRVAWTLALAFAGEDPDDAPIPPRVRRAIASTTVTGFAATVLLQLRDHYRSRDDVVVACLQRQGWRSATTAAPVVLCLAALTIVARLGVDVLAAVALTLVAGLITAVIAMVAGLAFARRCYRPGAPPWRLHAPPATWTMANVAVRPGAPPFRIFEVRALLHDTVAPGSTVGCVAGSTRTGEAYEKWHFVRVEHDDARMVLTVPRLPDQRVEATSPRTT